MGGRSASTLAPMPDGTQAPECNKAMAANATAHGVPWGVIEGFGNHTKPSSMLWLGAEDAECWGLMKWSAKTPLTTVSHAIDGALTNDKRKPDEVTAKDADDVLCRMNAGTSRIYVSTGQKGQGFFDAYRRACKRIAADPQTPKYAAIDIIMWLTLTDPDVLALKPGRLMVNILDRDERANRQLLEVSHHNCDVGAYARIPERGTGRLPEGHCRREERHRCGPRVACAQS